MSDLRADDIATLWKPQLLIGGELVDPGGETMDVISPADGSRLGAVPAASADVVSAAVDAAAAAFPAWRATNVRERQAAVLAIADYLQSDLQNLATLEAVDGGMPITVAGNDIRLAIAFIRYLSGLAYNWGGRTIPVAADGIDLTVRQPYGPTARIVPFNHPLLFATWKIAAPLLTGNTIVMKPPDQAPLSALRLAVTLRDIFPPGVVNIVTGPGAVTGDALVRHPGIKRIAFIGSVPTGRRILAAAAERNVPVTAELGGKNPHIIAADADLDRAVSAAVAGMNYVGAGQSCGSYSRVLAHESVYDEVVERIAARTREVTVGHPLAEDTMMGPLIGPEVVTRVQSHIQDAVDKGARVVAGGSIPEVKNGEGGFYFEPTVVADVTPEMSIATTELFGPVQSIMRWSTIDEAIEIANGTQFGLTASIHARDIGVVMRLVDAIETGSIAVNGDGAQHWMAAPFGGVKASGVGGKEDTVDELIDSTYEKNVFLSRQ